MEAVETMEALEAVEVVETVEAIEAAAVEAIVAIEAVCRFFTSEVKQALSFIKTTIKWRLKKFDNEND